MYSIDLTVLEDRLQRSVKRARERNIVVPTFAQMKDPALIPDRFKAELASIGLWDLHPRNLFRITWHNEAREGGGEDQRQDEADDHSLCDHVGLSHRNAK